jgi:ATP-dependent helicase/nuclease subunit A
MVTRARYANYLFLPPAPDKPGKSATLPATVRHMLQQTDAGKIGLAGTEYPLIARFGDSDWYRAHPIQPSTPPAAKAAALPVPDQRPVQADLFAETASAAPPTSPGKTIPLRSKRPSEVPGHENETVFQSARQAAKEAGIAVHAAFQRVEWLEGAEAALAGPGLETGAVAEVRACLREPALSSFFVRPGGRSEVWRERAFDIILEGTLQSGVFDRVIVERDATGKPVRAVLVDFKTGPVPSGARESATRHRPQLEIYRRTLSRLLGLPPGEIRTVVLFTATREAVDL